MKNDTKKIADIFKTLSCKTRLDIIVELLDKEECSVNDLAEKLNIPQPNVSQHLAILRRAGIIEGYRNGIQIIYRIIDKQVKKIIETIKD